MSKRVLIALTSHAELGDTGRKTGFYVSEAAEPWEMLTAAGHQVELVSVAGGVPPRDGENPDDRTQRRFLADPSIARQLAGTMRPEDVDASRFAAILFASGHGVMWDFPDNAALGRLVHVPAANFTANVIQDGRLITGQNPQSARGVAEAMALALG